jgi:hypothetical protein
MGLCPAGLHTRRTNFGSSYIPCFWLVAIYIGQSSTELWASLIGGLYQWSDDADKETDVSGDRATAQRWQVLPLR